MCLISYLLTADIVLHETEDWMEPAVFKSIQGTEWPVSKEWIWIPLTCSPNRILLVSRSPPMSPCQHSTSTRLLGKQTALLFPRSLSFHINIGCLSTRDPVVSPEFVKCNVHCYKINKHGNEPFTVRPLKV